MAKRKSKNFEINPQGSSIPSAIQAEKAELGISADDFVCVAFKYYQRNHECLSVWSKPELKKLSSWIEKTQKKTLAAIKSKDCHRLLGKKKLPYGISEDIVLYGLRVDRAARVFGFFIDNVFYLVWLDKNHDICD